MLASIFDDLIKYSQDPRLIAGGGIFLALAYKIYRILKEDRRADKQEDKFDKFYADLNHQLKLATERSDTLSQERNLAISETARITVERDHLKIQLLENIKTISDLKHQVGELSEQVRVLTANLAAYQARVEVLATELKLRIKQSEPLEPLKD